jgi:membrane protein YdbS with pleckstrin-like domain
MAQTATVSGTVEETDVRPEEQEPEAAAPVAEEAPGVERARWALTARQRLALAAGGAGMAAAALATLEMGRRASRLELWPGEQVTLSVRPRRAVLRYAASLGLWEMSRRATRYTVTDQRLVIQEGLVKRVACGIPLHAIRSVVVRAGPLEGYVHVHTGVKHRSLERPIGPLRSPTARRLADSIAAQRRAAREETDG